jgi:hypothetical protein
METQPDQILTTKILFFSKQTNLKEITSYDKVA